MLIGVIAEQELLALSIKPPKWIDGGPLAQAFQIPDTIYSARSTITGFVMPGLVDETDTLLGVESVGRSYITQDYQGIFPDPLTGDDTFYDFTHGFIPVLRPDMWYDTDFYLRPDVGINTRAISFITRFVDTDIIFSPSFSQGVAPVLFDSDDVIRAQVIRRAGDDIVLLAEVFSDVDIFFTPSLAKGLLPGLVAHDDVFYGSTGGSYLLPSPFAADDVFYAAFPANQLLPGDVLDTDVFIGPELRRPGNMGLFVDDDIMRSPAISFSPLLATLVHDTEIFHTSVIGEFPPLSPNDPFIDFDDTFYVPAISIARQLSPLTWTDIDTTHPPSIASDQLLLPGLLNDADTVSAVDIAAIGILLPNLIASDDAFSAPNIEALAGAAMVAGPFPIFVNFGTSREAYVNGVMVNL